MTILHLLCFVLSVINADQNYYQVLGVSEDATGRQITKAFRKLSLKYHPDKNKDDDLAAQKFLEVNTAYGVLSDEDKRQVYDTEGEEGLENMKKMAGATDMFGRKRSNKGQDYRMAYKVTLEQLYNGATASMQVERKILCTKCKGTGAKDGITTKCSKCKGSGQITVTQQMHPGMQWQMQQPCNKCGGKGKRAKHVCPHCRGSRQEMGKKELEVIIEKGMPHGHEIVFPRASEHAPGMTPGDVVLVLDTEKHALFTRHGKDLHMTMTISLREALLGFRKTVAQLDGRVIEVVREGVTRPGFVQAVKGEGMPEHNFPSNKGDLLIKYKVSFPRSFSQSEQDALSTVL